MTTVELVRLYASHHNRQARAGKTLHERNTARVLHLYYSRRRREDARRG